MRAERTNKIKDGTAQRYEYKSGVSKTELDIFHSLQSLTIENMGLAVKPHYVASIISFNLHYIMKQTLYINASARVVF